MWLFEYEQAKHIQMKKEESYKDDKREHLIILAVNQILRPLAVVNAFQNGRSVERTVLPFMIESLTLRCKWKGLKPT